jgi:hypothetical protein
MITSIGVINSKYMRISDTQRAQHARRGGSDSFAAGGGDVSPSNGGKI